MTVRRNLLYFIYGFLEGGAEHQMLQLAARMEETGRYHVHLACLLRQGELLAEAERLTGGDVPSFPIKSFYGPTMFAQTRRFAAYLREHRIEVVHAQDFYSNIFGMAGAALARVPARVAFKGETEFARTPRQKFVERCAFRLARAIVANAEAVRRHLIREGVPGEKIVTIHNGLDMRRVEPRAGASRDQILAGFNLPRGRRFVTVVANLRHPVKDIPMFLRAARRVRGAIPDAAFVVAGEGGLLDGLRAYAAELGLAGDAHFIGRCERVGDLLAVSDVCALSSQAEGFSNSILEYMAAGRPAVVTDVGGAREVVGEGETGHLVAAGDDAAMGERIAALLREPERARLMGERARALIEQKFSWATHVEHTEALYERLLARRAPERELSAARAGEV